MSEQPKFTGAVCKGSYVLGSACGKCERCALERAEHPERVVRAQARYDAERKESQTEALRKIQTSLECTAAWLKGGCNPLHAAEELDLNIAAVKRLREGS